MVLASQLLRAVLQLLLLTEIPFIWYRVSCRRVSGFFQLPGLKPAARVPVRASVLIFAGFALATLLPHWCLYQTGA